MISYIASDKGRLDVLSLLVKQRMRLETCQTILKIPTSTAKTTYIKFSVIIFTVPLPKLENIMTIVNKCRKVVIQYNKYKNLSS